jgi:hypothetical protein
MNRSRHRWIAGGLICMLSVAALGAVGGELVEIALRRQDGIVASLLIARKAARIEWRFESNVRVQDAMVRFNGREAALVDSRPYPFPGEQTAVLAMLDVGDATRQEGVTKLKSEMLALLSRTAEHRLIAFGVYAQSLHILAPDPPTVDSLTELISSVGAVAQKSELGKSLEDGIATVKQMGSNRRAIYVFTDGHDDGRVDLARVVAQARDSDVVLYFVLFPSTRQVDLKNILHVARATGGVVISRTQADEFLAKPFEMIDSGGVADFDLSRLERFFWEPGRLTGYLVYGENREGTIAIDLPFYPPLAGPALTVKAMAAMPMAWPLMALTVLPLGGGFGLWRFFKRRSPQKVGDSLKAQSESVSSATKHDDVLLLGAPEHKEAGVEPGVNAILEDIATRVIFPLGTRIVQIGRGDNNDLIIPDGSVSRKHAIVEQEALSLFSISNVSRTNVTKVNGALVENKTILEDGDEITIGQRKMLFRVVG